MKLSLACMEGSQDNEKSEKFRDGTLVQTGKAYSILAGNVTLIFNKI